MYVQTSQTVTWIGKAIKGTDPDSFALLTDTIARDTGQVYMRGKPCNVDATSFEVLSKSYARDSAAVYLIMDTKLKALKNVDLYSFEAVGAWHGRDAKTAFFQDKRMRLSKGACPLDLRPLGGVYASDGQRLYFTTQVLRPPAGVTMGTRNLQLRHFGDCLVNMPPVMLSDGMGCWGHGLHRGTGDWIAYPEAEFDTLEPIQTASGSYWLASYARDAHHVWFRETRVPDIDPAHARVFARDMLTNGTQLWHGANTMAQTVSEVTAIPAHFRPDTGWSAGTLLHHGTRIVLHDLETAPEVMADVPQEVPEWQTGIESCFHTLFHLFSRYLPHQWTPFEALRDMGDAPGRSPHLPHVSLSLTALGEICATLPDGTAMQRPASAWYTLACDLWAYVHGRKPSLLCYPALGIMYPRSTDLQKAILRHHAASVTCLCAHVWRAGYEEEARLLAYQCLALNGRAHRDLTREDLAQIAMLPRDLMPMLTAPHNNVSEAIHVSTHLAFARAIIAGGWLEHHDPAARIDAVSRLHAAILETGKFARFWDEIIPPLMARYTVEPLDAVREHLAMTLDAALIKGQVSCEVSHICHHAQMLPLIRFCLSHGINVIYNRARLIEALYATGAEADGAAELEALSAEIGEDHSLPGVYAHRLVYRNLRLWLLRGRIDAAYRKGSEEAHRTRLAGLEHSLDALVERFGPDCLQWDELQDLRRDLARYAQTVRPS